MIGNNYVMYGDINSEKDLGLTLEKVEISMPAIQEKKISIPGRNGSLDLSGYGGGVKYKNRSITHTFSFVESNKNYEQQLSMIANALHGKEFRISSRQDASFYYKGRVTVKPNSKKGRICGVKAICDCYPYKLEKYSTLEDVEWDFINFETDILQYLGNIHVSGTLPVTVIGMQMEVVPVFYLHEGSLTVAHQGIEYELSEGKNKFLGIKIVEGENEFILTGEGEVSIEYRGGCL